MELARDIGSGEPSVTAQAPAVAPAVANKEAGPVARIDAMTNRKHGVAASFNVWQRVDDAADGVGSIKGVGDDQAENDGGASVKDGNDAIEVEPCR